MATYLPRALRSLLPCTALLFVCLVARGEDDGLFTPEERAYWAFQPIGHPAPPKVRDARWVRNPIDAFILAKLESVELTPAAEADRRRLIRRAYLDLHGLPPTPEDVQRFLADKRPDAFERLIDRLLASPRYGERWARHWLDLVRYAETDGYNQDAERPHAWRYRDYVIAALNGDKPYDRFILEQVAGDEIAPDDPQALVATGFLRHWPYEFNQRNVPQQRMHILNDLTDVSGQVFLGLTVRCARCHDHKFDAILQADYFRLQAFFAPLVDRDDVPPSSPQQREQYQRELAAWQAATREIREKIAKLEASYRERERRKRKELFTEEIEAIIEKPASKRTPHEKQIGALAEKQLVITTAEVQKLIKGEDRKRWDALAKRLAEHEARRPKELPRVMTVRDVGLEAPPTIIPGDGELDDPETHVAPGFLSVLDSSDVRPQPTSTSTGRRTALARWLISKDNPLVARVIVNRLWHHHFHRGLVATPNDLGQQGDKCTHPELLDWLASELIAGGWSLKRMHRLMLTSATYGQASQVPRSPRAAEADPDNKLLWRMRSGRLEAEVIRDSMLAASGELNLKMSGKSVYPELPKGISVRHAWKATGSTAQRNRRSIYLFVKRNLLHPLLDSLDMPDPHESCARRQVTTTAPQALILLNGKWSLDRGAAFAGRLLREGHTVGPELIARAYDLAYSRTASSDEVALALAFLKRQSLLAQARLAAEKPVKLPQGSHGSLGRAQAAALVDFCHALLNSNEFIYVD